MKQAAKVLFHADSEPLSEYASRLEAVYPIFHGSFIQLTATYEDYLLRWETNRRPTTADSSCRPANQSIKENQSSPLNESKKRTEDAVLHAAPSVLILFI